MWCRRARFLISVRFDGELNDKAAQRLAGHLEGCPACRDLAQRQGELGSLLRRVPAPGPSADFAPRVMVGLDAPARAAVPSHVWVEWRRPVSAAVGAAAFVLGMLLVHWASDSASGVSERRVTAGAPATSASAEQYVVPATDVEVETELLALWSSPSPGAVGRE